MPFPFFGPFSRAAAAVPILLTAACVGAPGLGPKPELRDAVSVEAEQSLAGTDSAQWPAEDWWKGFGDPQLDALMAEGLAHSPDVAAAVARLQQASGMALEAGAPLYPHLDGEGAAYKDRLSLNNGFSDEIRQFLPRGWRTGANVAGRAQFDIDIWGRNRAALAAATSQARAAAIDLLEARLMLASAIAYAYTDLGQLFRQRDIREAALKIRTSSRDLVANRLANGLETRGSLRQADAELATARANLAAADEQIALRRNQIAALLGAGPDRGLSITRPAMSPAVPDGLPNGVTTDLVGRRPDIVSARERAMAAARGIDMARADFFPAIRLEGLIGLQSIGLGNLFESDSIYGRAGPAISLPIFRGGALRGRYKTARAAYDEAVADYDRTVVEAYHQVADIVTSRAATAERLGHARDALAAAEEAYSIATLRYEGGLSTYLDALVVEDRLLDARLAVADLESNARTLDIRLVRALGGGFGKEDNMSVKETPDG